MANGDDDDRAFSDFGDDSNRRHYPDVAEEGQPERMPVEIPWDAQLQDEAAQNEEEET